MFDFDRLLSMAVERGASDVHLKPNASPILRVHGHLEHHQDLGLVSRDAIDAAARRLLGERRYARLLEGTEMDFAHVVPGVGRFRINMFLAAADLRAVLRAIPSGVPPFEALHLPKVL